MPPGEGARPFAIDAAVDDTVSEAINRISLTSPRHKLFEHITNFVLSEKLARHGLIDIDDYLLRSNFVRESEGMYIAKNCSAHSILEVPTPIEILSANALDSMIEAQDHSTGIYTETTVTEVMQKMITPGIEPVIPGVEAVGGPGKSRLELTGMAVFKKGKLVGWLNEEESRGYHWLRPQGVQGGTLTVARSIRGGPVVLEVIRSVSNIRPEIKDGRPIIHINIKEEGNFYEERGTNDLLASEKNLAKLELEGGNQIKKEIMAAVRKSQKLDSDILGFGLAVSRKYPQQWKQMEPQWEKLYPTVQVEVHAVSSIRRTGLISRILRYK